MIGVLYLALAVVAGVAATVQGAANSGLAARIGFGSALVVNTVIVLLGAIALWFVQGARWPFWTPGTPPSLYVGGLCGFTIIAVVALVFPKIGAAHAIALMVVGQCVAALAIDHFGLFGLPRDPVSAQRTIGLALVAAGVLVLRW
jgi:transporter family-2 protein